MFELYISGPDVMEWETVACRQASMSKQELACVVFLIVCRQYCLPVTGY